MQSDERRNPKILSPMMYSAFLDWAEGKWGVDTAAEMFCRWLIDTTVGGTVLDELNKLPRQKTFHFGDD